MEFTNLTKKEIQVKSEDDLEHYVDISRKGSSSFHAPTLILLILAEFTSVFGMLTMFYAPQNWLYIVLGLVAVSVFVVLTMVLVYVRILNNLSAKQVMELEMLTLYGDYLFLGTRVIKEKPTLIRRLRYDEFLRISAEKEKDVIQKTIDKVEEDINLAKQRNGETKLLKKKKRILENRLAKRITIFRKTLDVIEAKKVRSREHIESSLNNLEEMIQVVEKIDLKKQLKTFLMVSKDLTSLEGKMKVITDKNLFETSSNQLLVFSKNILSEIEEKRDSLMSSGTKEISNINSQVMGVKSRLKKLKKIRRELDEEYRSKMKKFKGSKFLLFFKKIFMILKKKRDRTREKKKMGKRQKKRNALNEIYKERVEDVNSQIKIFVDYKNSLNNQMAQTLIVYGQVLGVLREENGVKDELNKMDNYLKNWDVKNELKSLKGSLKSLGGKKLENGGNGLLGIKNDIVNEFKAILNSCQDVFNDLVQKGHIGRHRIEGYTYQVEFEDGLLIVLWLPYIWNKCFDPDSFEIVYKGFRPNANVMHCNMQEVSHIAGVPRGYLRCSDTCVYDIDFALIRMSVEMLHMDLFQQVLEGQMKNKMLEAGKYTAEQAVDELSLELAETTAETLNAVAKARARGRRWKPQSENRVGKTYSIIKSNWKIWLIASIVILIIWCLLLGSGFLMAYSMGVLG